MQAIENAISAGDKGIIITPNGPGVNSAIEKARAAGIYVIALDTVPDPANVVDITFATDNFLAASSSASGPPARSQASPPRSPCSTCSTTRWSPSTSPDTGFLTGMGITVPDPNNNGKEAATGNYSGGTYTIACHEATKGAEDGGRTAMETRLSKNPNINVVYTINEPAAAGAYAARRPPARRTA